VLEPRALLAVTITDPLADIPAGNLVKNGSFEENVVTHSQKWNVFAPGTMAAWNIVPATVGVKAEIQRNGLGGWSSSQGSQWLELDGDENGPGKKWDATAMGRPERGLYSIHQTVSVTAGLTYTLMFDFAARPGTKLSQNGMRVSVLDSPTDPPEAAIVSERVTALSSQVVAKSAKPKWRMGTINFVAPADGNVVLEFRGLGQGDPFKDANYDPATDPLNDTYGMFLDNVVVVPVDLPVVAIKAIDDVAHELYGETGTYVITRESGRLDVTVPVQIIVSGDAGYGFHYQLSPDLPPLPVDGDGHQSTISLLPGVERLYVTLTPLPEDTDNKLRRATIELSAPEIPLYSIAEGYESATVTIIPADQRDLIITGRITYEGPTGVEGGNSLTLGSLPVRAAKVEIWDKNGGFFGFGDKLVGTTYTDDNGQYEIVISSVDTVTFGGYVDPYVAVVAQSAPENIVTFAHEVTILDASVPARKEFKDDARQEQGPGSVTLDGAMTDADDEDENGAFSVFDALYSFSRYHATLPDVEPGTVKARVTDPNDPDAVSNYKDGEIEIIVANRFSWDTIGHEYGHFAHNHAGVALGKGKHTFAENLRFRHGESAWRLAFTEGFATYFSIVAQALTPKPPAGVAGFGDTKNWSIQNLAITSSTDLEAEGPSTPEGKGAKYGSLGEDNEVSVFRILWDLYDPANDDPIGDIGAIGVWNLVTKSTANAAPFLRSLYSGLIADASIERIWAIGKVFADHKVVPAPLEVHLGDVTTPLESLDNPPTFVISPLYGSNQGHPLGPPLAELLFEKVEILFYSANGIQIEVSGSTEVTIPEEVVPTVSWTPTKEQWAEIMLTWVGEPIRWSVLATTEIDSSFKGKYESFSGTLTFG
jgi:hypothetical protein